MGSARCRRPTPSPCGRAWTARSRRWPSRKGRCSRRATCWCRSTRRRSRPALDQATAKLAQDQASLNNAKQDLERTTILSPSRAIATQQLLDQRTANVASLTAQVQADQAAIESAKVQLAYTTISSPLTGRAGFRLVDPGNIVHAADQTGILTITQLQPISVVFTAPEQQLPAINDALKGGPAEGDGLQLGRPEARWARAR